MLEKEGGNIATFSGYIVLKREWILWAYRFINFRPFAQKSSTFPPSPNKRILILANHIRKPNRNLWNVCNQNQEQKHNHQPRKRRTNHFLDRQLCNRR